MANSTGERPSAITPLLTRSSVHQSEVDDDYLPSPTETTTSSHAPRAQKLTLHLAFLQAVLSCLCAGSITAFSLYGPHFQGYLHYSQYAINSISIAGELGMYLPVPIWGLLCDRYNPRLASILSGILFGFGYGLASLGWNRLLSPPIMLIAFASIGMGTSCMYLSAVSTCAKNFGRGRWKGIALAIPIAAFGLSGFWISIVGRAFFTRNAGREMEVGRFLEFLAFLVAIVGFLGGATLHVVNEDHLIDERVDLLASSASLDGRPLPNDLTRSVYGAVDVQDVRPPRSDGEDDRMYDSVVISIRSRVEEKEEAYWKKQLLLNIETKIFLSDPTMWFLAGGFFLVAGAGEAFQNNMGTLVNSLSAAPQASDGRPDAFTQVSIIALTSTFARLFTGVLSDYWAPYVVEDSEEDTRTRPQISRVVFLLFFSMLHACAYILLTSSVFEKYPLQFGICTGLVGLGYGAAFSLVPIIISVIWGVQNFATNWGIVAMFPAGGATLWSAVFAVVYEDARTDPRFDCRGYSCYGVTAWGWTISVILAMVFWSIAWKGKTGWHSRAALV